MVEQPALFRVKDAAIASFVRRFFLVKSQKDQEERSAALRCYLCGCVSVADAATRNKRSQDHRLMESLLQRRVVRFARFAVFLTKLGN